MQVRVGKLGSDTEVKGTSRAGVRVTPAMSHTHSIFCFALPRALETA